MRAYLSDFLTKQRYDAADAAVLLAAYDRIMQHPAAAALWAEAEALYDADHLCDYKEIIEKADGAAALSEVQEYTAELLIFLCLTRRLRQRYEERGIDPAIFERSVEDLRYKLEECKLVYGIVGSFVAEWFAGFFRLKRFGLGRLQFEVVDFGHH